jgi:DNA-binding LytR/AlgR family response regulator
MGMNKEKIRVLIVDDEPIARDILETYLKTMEEVELVGTCKNALEAFKLISLHHIDLLLLDINMPEISGVDLIKTLKNPPRVIFVTAYPDYAVESYELGIVDYLLKPVSQERFGKAMEKALKLVRPDNSSTENQVPVVEKEKLMVVRSDGKWLRIDVTRLLFIEGLKDYVQLYSGEGKIIVRSTMKNFEEQLATYPNFLRVHKSFIVNMDFISETDGSFVKVKDQLISIGNTYKDDVKRAFNSYKVL